MPIAKGTSLFHVQVNGKIVPGVANADEVNGSCEIRFSGSLGVQTIGTFHLFRTAIAAQAASASRAAMPLTGKPMIIKNSGI